jgi:hypothetical protein
MRRTVTVVLDESYQTKNQRPAVVPGHGEASQESACASSVTSVVGPVSAPAEYV